MKPLSQKEISLVEENYLKHNSLRKVSRLLHFSPNTVKKYVFKKMKVKTHNIVKNIRLNDERLIGAYIGIWMGDGTQYLDNGYRIKICCNKRNEKLNKFIQEMLIKLFGKSSELIRVSGTNQAYIRFKSKFIFEFVYRYAQFSHNKTQTVRLKEKINSYSKEFLEGCLLGLVLTDGYLKKIFHFNVISAGLATNVMDMLKESGLNPSCYIYQRAKYGWKDLYIIRLNVNESRKLKSFLDETIKEVGCKYSFEELKYNSGPAES